MKQNGKESITKLNPKNKGRNTNHGLLAHVNVQLLVFVKYQCHFQRNTANKKSWLS